MAPGRKHPQEAELDAEAVDRLLGPLRYVEGDYNGPGTFAALTAALDDAQHPAFYLAIPPALFGTVIEALGRAGLAEGAHVIVEKPFGRDLPSARELNRVARRCSPRIRSSSSITSLARRRA